MTTVKNRKGYWATGPLHAAPTVPQAKGRVGGKTNSPLGNPHAARLSQMAARRADNEDMYSCVWALPNTTVQNTRQYMCLEVHADEVAELPEDGVHEELGPHGTEGTAGCGEPRSRRRE